MGQETIDRKSIFHHTAIAVDNIKVSVHFYEATFDCKILHEDKSWALLSSGNHKLSLVLRDSEHPPHIAFISPLANYYNDLKTHRDGYQYRYIEDPSGNVIEILKLKEN